MKRVIKSYIIAFYFNYAVVTYRWSKKVFTSLYFYGLLVTMILLVSLSEAPKKYTVTLTMDEWRNTLWVISKSNAPEPVIKKVTDAISSQLPDTTKNNNCKGKVPSPYKLIRWSDKTFGIIKKDDAYFQFIKYVNPGYSFSPIKEHAEHFKDSCEAKVALKRYLENKLTYKEL